MSFVNLLELPLAPLLYDAASFPFALLTTAIIRSHLLQEGAFTILDVGSGTGNAAVLLGQGFSVTSVEPSPNMRLFAELKGVKSIEGYAQALPESLGLYDAVIANFVLRHLPPEALGVVLSQLDAHVRPGGLLVLSDLLLPILGPSEGRKQFLGVLTLYNPHSLAAAVSSLGYGLAASYILPLLMVLIFKKL